LPNRCPAWQAANPESVKLRGECGMGKVNRLFDKKVEEEVALKLVKPEIAADRK
jgi:hypothetical protein